MKSLFDFLLVVALTWWLVYGLFYSPKARIRTLHRQIRHISIKIARMKREMPDEAKRFDEMLEKSIIIRYNMINALLEYNFDPEEDEWYISKNRPPSGWELGSDINWRKKLGKS
jgi:hypothetical protein